MKLPQEFMDAMEALLGEEEYQAYRQSGTQEHFHGLRVNTGKISVENFLKITPFQLRPIPWVENGFFYDESEAVTKHPHYHAGLYYVQEPSAMIPADRLLIEEGDRVLDLCAAPGGKATELGARLKGSGLLVANDISNSRAKGLLKNLELFGVPNILVTCESPGKLGEYFTGFFDKILIDAPCSGEGMFRKDASMIKSWMERGPWYYSRIQRELLKEAAGMLKPGGLLLYSTCTFSPLEDEASVQYLLDELGEFEVLPLKWYEGFSQGRPDAVPDGPEDLKKCARVWPHRMPAEGHFIALLKKSGEKEDPHASWTDKRQDPSASRADEKQDPSASRADERQDPHASRTNEKQKVPAQWEQFANENLKLERSKQRITVYDNRVYAMPKQLKNIRGLRFLRTGLYLGEVRKNRFEPSQALAMSLTQEQAGQWVSFDQADVRVRKYLKGETVELTEREADGRKGWILVCVDGYPLGWAKVCGTSLKNKYYPGWRIS